jgi:hypothetical protein
LPEGPDTRDVDPPLAGVVGTCGAGPGVRGTSFNNDGVYGQTEGSGGLVPHLPAGVYGAATVRPGAIGYSRTGDGAQGLSFTGTGIRAVSFFGPGIDSLSGALTAVTGTSGARTSVPNTIDSVAGVIGTSGEHVGVLGTSTNEAGVAGYSKGAVGVYGETGAAGGYAGFFRGNLRVTGRIDAGIKDAIVPFPDGSQRVLHCMESPEHWFEDFGIAKLKRGRAVVKLDADFGKVIKRGDYHVFFTPRGDCRGLYVRSQGGASFEVRELAGGKSSVAFSYRIVGRRKDITAHKRFAKIDTRLPLPAAAARPPRQPKPSAAALRAFVARLEREARQRRPKGARQGGRPRALPKGLRRARFMRRLAKT